MGLGKDVFHALALVAWADGRVHESEARALLAAAEESGLPPGDLAEVRRALENRAALDDVKKLALDPEERSFVYGIATWLTRVDGSVAAEEVEALAKLGDLLELGADERRRAEAASFVIADFERGTGAPAHDVRRLAEEIRRDAKINRSA